MDILKAATDWAKAEVFSAQFFIAFGIIFLVTSFGFHQLGKTDMAKAFIYPMLVAGILILAVGVGLLYSNQSRLSSFAKAYNDDASAFVGAEIIRADKTIAEYENIVFKVIPVIIVVAALLIIFLNGSLWKAISITTIAMMVVILLVDSNAHKRMEVYKKQLEYVVAHVK